jgi:hypothetical protein
VSFVHDDIKRLAREAAARRGVDFLGIREGSGPHQTEVRFQHRNVNWHSVLIVERQPTLSALADEIDGLAEECARGPTS